jgi:hypothetical protein
MKLFRNILIVTSVLAFAIVGLAGFTGCSDTNLLETTVGVLTLEFQVADVGSTQYEDASLTVANVTVRPLDQEAQDSLGGANIVLANKVRSIDLASSSTALNPASLPAAVFVLEGVNFFPSGRAPIILQDADPDPDAVSVCDRKPALPETPDERAVISSALIDFTPSQLTINPNVLITVPSGGTLVHPITINSSLLIQAYKNAMVCSDVAAECEEKHDSLAPVPCLISFNANQFLDELDAIDWVSF